MRRRESEKNRVQLKVKTESLPARCEICHQADCFNADENFCSRCRNIAHRYENDAHMVTLASNQMAIDVFAGSAKLGLISGSIICGCAGFCWAVLPDTPDSAIVLATLAGIGGPLIGVIAGSIFSFIIMAVKWLNRLDQ